MSFLEQFFEDNFQSPNSSGNSSQNDEAPTPPIAGNSFKQATDSELAAHLEVDRYDGFQLTEAVRPAMDLKIKPTEGYRHEHYQDDESGASIPVVMAAASKEKLFPLFMELIEKLGPVVDVVLESSHEGDAGDIATSIAKASTWSFFKACSMTSKICCSTMVALESRS